MQNAINNIPVGEWSHGTHRLRHLFDAIREVSESSDWLDIVDAIDAIPESDIDDETEYAIESFDDVVSMINSFLPSGYYFGMHEGDGSSLGIWECDNDEND